MRFVARWLTAIVLIGGATSGIVIACYGAVPGPSLPVPPTREVAPLAPRPRPLVPEPPMTRSDAALPMPDPHPGPAARVIETRTRVGAEIDEDGNTFYVFPNRQRLAPPKQQALVRRELDVLEPRHAPSAAAAAVLSMIVPGAGQLYAGKPVSAVVWFAVVTMGYLLLIVPGVLLHILCIASVARVLTRRSPAR
jgi:hypothetical protein